MDDRDLFQKLGEIQGTLKGVKETVERVEGKYDLQSNRVNDLEGRVKQLETKRNDQSQSSSDRRSQRAMQAAIVLAIASILTALLSLLHAGGVVAGLAVLIGGVLVA